jgi:phage baseplate assembly protein W
MNSNIRNVFSPDWQLSNSTPNELVQGVDDITQCIDNILRTQPGTDPLRPTFGCRYIDHIDKPVTVAAPLIVNEIIDAITTWEKRVKIQVVNYRIEAENVIYEISWTSKYGDGVNIIPL